MYEPTGTAAAVTAASPTRPWIVTPPAADNNQSVGPAKPPALFVTSFTNVNVGATTVFVIVHVAT